MSDLAAYQRTSAQPTTPLPSWGCGFSSRSLILGGLPPTGPTCRETLSYPRSRGSRTVKSTGIASMSILPFSTISLRTPAAPFLWREDSVFSGTTGRPLTRNSCPSIRNPAKRALERMYSRSERATGGKWFLTSTGLSKVRLTTWARRRRKPSVWLPDFWCPFIDGKRRTPRALCQEIPSSGCIRETPDGCGGRTRRPDGKEDTFVALFLLFARLISIYFSVSVPVPGAT